MANNTASVPLADTARITDNGKIAELNEVFWKAPDASPTVGIVNQRLGDTATVAVVQNADSSKTC